MTSSDTVVRESARESDDPAAPASRMSSRLHRFLTALVVLGILSYALIGVGAPLLGLNVFAATDLLGPVSPYYSAGLAETVPQTTFLNDTVDAALPNTALFAEALANGQLASWNPYIGGGVILGSGPNYALLNPVTWPYFVMSASLAPGYVKLVEILVAVGGCFLFLRRIGLGRAAALLGGLAFSSSAFMVAWTNWPQTRVAAFIPALFWGLELLVQERRVRDAALVCLTVAAMLFGGFPAVTGYALMLGGIYLLVRVWAEYRGQWRRMVAILAGASAALGAAAGLAAIQLLPFVSAMSGALVRGRRQSPADHLEPQSLITTIAPWAMGSTGRARPPFWYLPTNFVESLSYVGAAALVLVVVAVATPWAARAALPRGVWSFLVGTTAVSVVVLYVGGPALAVLQKVPVLFSHNFVGRARSVFGFVLAVLVAVGFELLLRHRERIVGALTRRQRLWAIAVWAAVALGGLAVFLGARRSAGLTDIGRPDPVNRVAHLDREVLVGMAFLLAALGCVAVLWWLGRRSAGRYGRIARVGALALLPVLVTVQALTLVVPYWPRADHKTFYPVTDVHRYLMDNLGPQRFASNGAMYAGADSIHHLRALSGHAYYDAKFAELLETMPGTQFGQLPTLLYPPRHGNVADSAVLDRLAVRYYVAPQWSPVYGRETPAVDDGSTLTLASGRPVTVRMPVAGPVRGVGLVPTVAFDRKDVTARVDVRLLDASGTEVARAFRLERKMVAGQPFTIPIAGEGIAPDTPLTAEFTVRAKTPLVVRAQAGKPAVTAITPIDDGVRLVHAGSAAIWQRLHALDRVRWASGTVLEPDSARRLRLLSAGPLDADTVVLDQPGPAASGAAAQVRIVEDGLDEIEVAVDAAGAGYLVVGDAIQRDWVATVDGKPAPLVSADHGVAAVAVPPGRHTVRLRYEMPYRNAGAWITGVTAAGLLGLVVVERWRGRSAAGRSRRRVEPVED